MRKERVLTIRLRRQGVIRRYVQKETTRANRNGESGYQLVRPREFGAISKL
jgi:hypothetical protein